MLVAHIGKLQENTAALCKMAAKLSSVKRRMRNIRMECRRRRIPDVRHSSGMSAEQNSRCETSGWNVQCHTSQGGHLRVQGVGTPPPDNMEHSSLSGATPSGFPKRTHGAFPYLDSLREKHTALAIITPRTIAYPIRICCLDH
uniref:Uncharacterized protein n=1 Tax=Vitis vinifera TaxID=29760 RepID=A5C894_VITVI|nr:hypothetical protein VITISV_042527 [Vitis vinifera]